MKIECLGPDIYAGVGFEPQGLDFFSSRWLEKELNFGKLTISCIMNSDLEVNDFGNQLTITLPHGILAVEERRAFVEFVKMEWIARQSQLSQDEADLLSQQADSSWWSSNRENILSKISAATSNP